MILMKCRENQIKMSSPKRQESGTFIPVEGKRLKAELRTYSSRRSDKTRSRRTNSSEGLLSPSKSGKSREKYAGPPTVILDNGSYTAKIGMSSNEAPTVIPNCIMKVKSERKRFFIGNQIEECRDLSGLYYLLPCEKGYILKWTVQKPVWDYIFNNICPVEDKPVIMTQPLFNFKAIQEITDEIFFEEYEIKSMFRVNPTDLAKYEYLNNVVGKNVPCIIVDSGFSNTTVIPYIGGKKYYKAARRITIGGKVLTNHLKDIISYRQLHVMDETYVINQVKEDTCYVSPNFKEDMKIAGLQGEQNTIVKNYVLPDFNTIRRGYTQDSNTVPGTIAEGCQILRLNNERFTVPELLFHPSDIGMESRGIAESIVKCIMCCPAKDQPMLAKHIVIVGGNANFPGFKERVYADVRSHLPDHWSVNVYKPNNPITFTWKGGKSLSEDPKIKSLFITKEQYEEKGSAYTYERFSDWVNMQKAADQETNKPAETEPVKPGISRSGSFTRFDLFGKYEPEAEELSDIEEDNTETDKMTKEASSENNRGTEGTGNADVSKDPKEGDNESEGTSNGRESITEPYQEDSGDTTATKSNEKGNSKNNKTTNSLQSVNIGSVSSNFFESYDFNVFDNTYI